MNCAVAGLAGLSLALTCSATAHGQSTVRLGEILVIEAVDGKPEVPAGHLFLADRGSRKGQYAVVTTHAGPAGAGAAGANVRRSEYHLLSAATAGSLPDVDVLGMHFHKVRPNRRQAFERFVAEKLHPAVANLRPDLRVLYYKTVTGPDSGGYVALFALTKASRDKYWPGGADSDALRAAFSPAVQALTKELATYLVEGSYLADKKFAAAVFESRDWTDFVLVPPAR